MSWGSTGLRFTAAAIAILLWILLCVVIARSERRKRLQAAQDHAIPALPAAIGKPWLIAYASQTGTCEDIAWQTAKSLHAAGVPAQVMALGAVTPADLAVAERALFVTSTYGEGDPPDAAEPFARKVMAETLALAPLQFAVLALGDREYVNFCGFGRTLDAWLTQCGAQPMFDRVEVDNVDDAALLRWREELGLVVAKTGAGELSAWEAAAWQRWRIAARRHLNPGSAGAPTFHIELTPVDAVAKPSWHSGDLVQVLAPGDDARPREYSIASLPADGSVQLLVRQERHVDGQLGVASGWLTEQNALDGEVKLRLRPHRAFQLGDNAHRPLILVGNGTGLAGLRGHLKARAANGIGRNWLVFGERQEAFDYYHRDELEAWRANGVLERADIVFSRDQPERRYVQDALRESAGEVREWLNAGAAVYVCGSLEGMAGGVDAALKEIAGAEAIHELAEAGRYRRDVY